MLSTGSTPIYPEWLALCCPSRAGECERSRRPQRSDIVNATERTVRPIVVSLPAAAGSSGASSAVHSADDVGAPAELRYVPPSAHPTLPPTRSKNTSLTEESPSGPRIDHDGSASAPLLSPITAAALSVLYSALYVGVIYLNSITRPRPGLERNSTFVIQARVRGVTMVTMLCVGITAAVMHYVRSPTTWWSTLGSMGITYIGPRTAWDILKSLLLTGVLFQGPMMERILTGDWKDEGWVYGRFNWIGWRNYVVVCHPFPPQVPVMQ